ncbi:hypothetical protein [Amycolatopsis sp. NPDC059021]|uniref:hypothetical protein n=1 Tax=Amycolatopsis sp. NPDC059021 TaxID=3346704 RepID=UPI00366D8FDF
MDYPTQVTPEAAPVRRSHDPVAVALANASLLSVGYLLLGRRKLAVFSLVVTAALVTLLVTVARSVWLEAGVVLWWAALIAHGWFLARRRAERVVVRRQRIIALAVAIPVLLAFGLLRFDAARIEHTVTEARHSGDCGQAETALRKVWFGHRVADAPMTVRGEKTVQACGRLRTAKAGLTAASAGDVNALKAGFDGLASILAQLPGHEKMAEVTLDGFLNGLPAKNACHTAAISDWLFWRHKNNTVLDRSAAVVGRIAPAALVGCGDELAAAEQWEQARARYQQFLDRYSGQELTGRAEEGVKKATLAIELANVRGLLRGPASAQPAYCDKPAQYSGAAPYGKGTNRALFYGSDEYTGKLPAEWRGTDAAEAVLVVCAGKTDYGTPVQTCPYHSEKRPELRGDVTFHKIAIPVKAYELRTGKLVVETTVEIGGASCPETFTYSHFGTIELGPPPKEYVTASDADIRAAFTSLITP